MAKIRKLILHCEVETAQRKHYCKHNSKHILSKGDLRLTLVLNDGRGTKVHYCKECALKMIENAQNELKKLETKLTKEQSKKVLQ